MLPELTEILPEIRTVLRSTAKVLHRMHARMNLERDGTISQHLEAIRRDSAPLSEDDKKGVAAVEAWIRETLVPRIEANPFPDSAFLSEEERKVARYIFSVSWTHDIITRTYSGMEALEALAVSKKLTNEIMERVLTVIAASRRPGPLH